MVITLIISFVLENGSWITIPLVMAYWAFLMIFCIGIAWFLSLITLVLRDIQQSIGLVLMLVIIISPFAYTPDMVPGTLKLLLIFNPLSYFVYAFQAALVNSELPAWSTLAMVVGLSTFTFGAGYKFFNKKSHAFFDYA